jgi:hypothetical protein
MDVTFYGFIHVFLGGFLEKKIFLCGELTGGKEETERVGFFQEPSVPLFTSWGHLQLALNLSCGSFQLDSGLAVRTIADSTRYSFLDIYRDGFLTGNSTSRK